VKFVKHYLTPECAKYKKATTVELVTALARFGIRASAEAGRIRISVIEGRALVGLLEDYHHAQQEEYPV
jgi:hypothetical protein